jgi:histone deacetylase 1/2
VKDYLGNVLHWGPLRNGLYNFSVSFARLQPQALSSIQISTTLWLRRLGHASFPVINKVISFPITSNKSSICSHCQMAKSHALPFSNSHIFVSKPLELLYSDVWGPAPILSTTYARYYIRFLDNSTKFLWLFPLKLKSDALQIFQKFQAAIERQFNTKIKVIQTDWGGEYRSLNHFLQTQGITHRVTCPYTHQQAGAIERRHRQIMEVGLALLAHSDLPNIFWEDAFLTAVHIINRLPTLILQHKSPYEMVNNSKPDFNFLRVFGCACWPYLRPYNKHKMDFRSKTCIFIGYSSGHQGYKCLDFSTGKIYVSRHVVFDESLFPYEPPQIIVPSIHETLVILPSNLQLSYARFNFSTGSNFQTAAPFPQNIATPIEPQFDFDVTTATFVHDPTQNQHADDRPPPSLVSVPPSQPQNTHPMTTRNKNNIH